MTEELDVLRIISERLRAADIPFTLTGSAQGLLRGVTREYGSSPGRWSGR
jgi:hypothetical protein